MFNISTINEDDIAERLLSLPEAIENVLDSPESFEAVREICASHHLTDPEQILSVQQVVGFVLMGYIHSSDLGSETNYLLNLNDPKLADSLADAIAAKILAPIKDELEKNYRPVAAQPVAPAPIPVASAIPV